MDKSNWSLIFERPKRIEEKRRGEDRRKVRGREEEEKRRRKEEQKGMESNIKYGILKFV